jgi:putative aldouronate transport system substrate-binding protein
MALSAFLAGCSYKSGVENVVTGEEEDAPQGERNPVTLTFWLPCEEGTTDEAVALVEAAINKELKAQFTTAIELKVFPIDEYMKAVDERLSKIEKKVEADKEQERIQREIAKSLRAEGITTKPQTTEETETTEVQTTRDEDGVVELKYPRVGEYQFDIFCITSYEDYLALIERDALSELDTALGGAAKVLRSYIYPTFLNAAKFNGVTHAIPNNHGLGEYKFLLVNKELVDKYDYDPDTLTTIEACEEFIRDIGVYEEDESIAPLLSWVDPPGMTYWSPDGSWNVLASLVPNNTTFNTKVAITSIFKINAYKANFKLMRSLQDEGLLAEDPSTVEKFGVGVISGDYSDVEKYKDDYYIHIYETPTATQKDVFAGAFGISAYTNDFKRAIEVLIAINTDPTIRNLLQYGIEGVHYELDDEDRAVKISNDYNMNLLHTGNVYMAYPSEDMDPDQWEYDKQKNLSSKLSPFLYCPNLFNSENAAYYEELANISKEYYERLQNVPTADIDTFFSDAQEELADNQTFTKMSSESAWAFSPAYIYNEFYNEYFAPDEEQ